jgi:predicted Holliday junction resolvase-like endonuclease
MKMLGIPSREVSETVISVIRSNDQMAGYCPSCRDIFRLSEVELFYIPDRKRDFLSKIRKKESDLAQRVMDERNDAIKRSRSALMGSLVETVRPFLPGFKHHPSDLRGIWDPVDYISFNGLATRDVESITFLEVKTGRSNLNGIERSIQQAIDRGRVTFETVTRPSELDPRSSQ